MATAPTNSVVRFVRKLAGPRPAAAGLPDHVLLARFAHDRDEAAFAALVRRHGPLVLAVCRRVLGDWHAAEDCLQQTFLVLAAKAGRLERPEALGPWLHGVAVRTALKARTRARRRRRQEEAVARGPAVEQPDDLAWRDLRPVLDEAVLALDEKYRVPFVLHYLEGATVAEVARRLGCPAGTVSARLARAKERLRARLARRGVALSAAALAAAVSPRAASAALPEALAASVASAAIRCGAVPAWLITFTREALSAMWTSKARGAVLALVSLGLAGVGAGVLTCRGPAAEQAVVGGPQAQTAARPPALPKAEGAPAAPADEAERKLRLAFGDDCKDVLSAAIRLEFRSLQLVLAAERFGVEPDGRVKFSPCWMARFCGGAAAAAPTTVCCDAAYFTFNRPVRDFANLGGRNVLAVEPRGGVRIGFGRTSPARSGAEELRYSRLREHRRLELPHERFSLTVRGVEGKKLVRPVLKRLNGEGQVEYLTTAREGELRVNTEKRTLLIRLRSGAAEGRDGSQADFEEKVFEVPLPNAPDGR